MIQPSLRYHITNAQTGIRYNQPTMSIKQQKADLSIQQDKAEIMMDVRPGQLSINQTEAFVAMDRKGPLRRADEHAANSLVEFSKNVKKNAQQGDQMMRIENGGGAVAAIAKQNSARPIKQLAIGYIPKSPFDVRIDYSPSELKIDVQINDPVIQYQSHKPRIEIPPWSVEPYIQTMPNIDFEYIGQNVNLNA
ncbi:DUF6470 family protein [Jeotgalibacillus soli]|uniref:Uncharacterized protein n=1 Tax=Jeotgalibacillus soli TaxID=889306 RepID=A0A0C2RIC3_9BACL|nr:DUF6470 family protein [Jeotgalibacillus soli]KIL49915.1 hypothetical protein KP78_13830 [Jeotgalibacillus soli]